MARTQVAFKLNAQPGEFITRTRAIAFAPTLIAENPHVSRSTRYAQTKTIETVDAMNAAGFGLTSVQKVDARTESKKGFEKHLLRFAPFNGGGKLDRHEIVNFNSHDGTTADVFMLGVYRYACANNVITGSTFEEMRIRHSGQANQKAIEAADFMVGQFAKLDAVVDAWKSITLSPTDYCELFTKAAALVVPAGEDEHARKLAGNVVSMFAPRRAEDTGRDLWTAFNVAQERILSGGLRTKTRNEVGAVRRGTTRGVNAIDATVKLNRGLWDIAAKYAA